ncbi:enhancer of polycomb -like protein [Brachionus plicatilis]|uniref:Enhancer of polycomb-like protein n=1 Tax=Brachionus plicatilis TaxID=10195 RepID=A0A3M7RHX5_BRAPC|nr:enhancer of polycomb -like protein [Brachionus plicatilis]
MSKLSFRARQVDYSKPLPIYYNNEIPDLQDFAAINRSVPQMPTGMEKDEEAEHHLQRALSALQVYGTTTSNEYAIPTPNVEIDNKMYESIYSVECPKQKQYIRIQPFSNDFDYPDYDADIEDEQWLKEYKNKLPDDFTDDLFLFFENTMDRLEKAVGFSTNLMSRDEAKMLLLESDDQTEDLTTTNDTTDRNKYKTERDEFILCIYEYWKLKRLKCNHPLTPTVLTDKCGVVTAPNNPYLVFRRRTEKMQTRKNRKTEEQSYEKMLILKRDLVRAQQLLKLVKQREAVKKDFIKLTLETFEKRLKSNDYDGTLTETIKSNILKTKSPAVQAIILQSKANTDKKLSSLVKSPSVKRELADTKLMQTVNTKRLKKDKKLSPVNINTIQPVAKSATTPSTTKTTLANLFKSDKNKRFIRRPIGAPSTPAKVDSDLCESKTPSPVRFEPLTAQDIEYNEELRQNNIENLDSALTEAKSLFSTSVEKDGYWSFKRKEGCKYLAVCILLILFYEQVGSV